MNKVEFTKCIPPQAVEAMMARRKFKEKDQNGDGTLSRQEYVGDSLTLSRHESLQRQLEFAKLDKNQDGQLSQKEFAAGQPGRPPALRPFPRPERPRPDADQPSLLDRLKDLAPLGVPVLGPMIGLKRLADKFLG